MKDVMFYYPQHFNRTKEGTNPFFNVLLRTCDKHGITYDLWEEPDGGTDKPRNSGARKADSFFWTVTVLRKIIGKIFRKKDFFWCEKPTGKIMNLLTLGRFRYRNYITISGSMFHLFSHINSKAKVFDMQHGIIYKHHPTFFDANDHLRNQFHRPNLHLLFWGEGYKADFVRGEEKHMEGKAHAIGYPIRSTATYREHAPENGVILVSLQFTYSVDESARQHLKDLLTCFLEQVEPFGLKVLLKHHPRYNNCIAIDDILNRFTNVELTDLSLEELIGRTFLHVTYSSTTAFEFAEYGIPTFFTEDPNEHRGLENSFFYTEYGYPLYWGMKAGDVIRRLSDTIAYAEDAKAVRAWYDRFYSPFDEEAFIALLH